MNNKDLARAFCAQLKPSGKGSNFYYRGKVAFSYGEHFPIAFIREPRIFINSDKYSVTTTRQQSHMRNAAHFAQLDVTEVDTATIRELIRE